VCGTHRTSSSVDGVADRGANAGRDGRACGKGRRGEKRGRRTGGGSDRGGATRRGGGTPTVSRPTATQARRARMARLRFGQERAEAADSGSRWQWERVGGASLFWNLMKFG
jgi:hypothetical protein